MDLIAVFQIDDVAIGYHIKWKKKQTKRKVRIIYFYNRIFSVKISMLF